ncbi:SEL1-like repeat protein [Helicobacter suis]|uniref:SEL1-like repeat protein n=1 Tax=Helicobacter suis TaxID=104628 RepID=UPI0013D62907|nr:SEL1-like repeat protein [Helicobacter suis]
MKNYWLKKWAACFVLILLVVGIPLRAGEVSTFIATKEASALVQEGMADQSQGRYKQAYQAYKTAHDKKEDLGTALLATLLYQGLGVKADPFEAKTLFESVLRNYEAAFRESLLRSRIMIGTTMFVAVLVVDLGLADMTSKGIGMNKDPKKALKMYRAILLKDIKASANMTALSKTNQHEILSFGMSLLTLPFSHIIDLKHLNAQDFSKFPIMKHFAGVALYRVGMAYKEGIGTKVKPKKAIKFLEKAVEFGNEEAMQPLESLRSRH